MNSYPGATSATLYDIDYSQDVLAIPEPPEQRRTAHRGRAGVEDATNNLGFDIAA